MTAHIFFDKNRFWRKKGLGVFFVSLIYLQMTDAKNPKKPQKYLCENCEFVCSNKKDYTRHLNTAKHKILTNTSMGNSQNADLIYECECGKSYKHRQSLYSHKKKCNYSSEQIVEEYTNEIVENKGVSTEMFMQLIQQNQDLQNLVLNQQNKLIEVTTEYKEQQAEQQKQNMELQKTVKEIIPKIGNNNNNTNCNNTNNTFNVQLFLNEQCKDALNLTDFLRSLQIGMDDLMKIGEVGYSDGLSRIMVDGLKNLSVTERPIHCTDAKREILYVKDDNIWEKEKEGNPKLQKSIKYIANKNEYLMKTEWAKEHPHWEEDDTNDNRAYHKLVFNMLGGTDDQETLNKKISKQLLPEVKLDKNIIL
jgi:hypothetical protein